MSNLRITLDLYLPISIDPVNIFINTSISISKNNYIYKNSDFINDYSL